MNMNLLVKIAVLCSFGGVLADEHNHIVSTGITIFTKYK